MTTTPAPTDHDTLKALQDRARNLVPWQARIDLLQRHDALLDELAKTRADVEKLTTALDIVALREIRQAADLAIVERERDRLRDSVQRARQEIAALRAAAEANPATTAEPADEPKATCGAVGPDLPFIACTYPAGHAPIPVDVRGVGMRDMDHGNDREYRTWWNDRTALVHGDALAQQNRMVSAENAAIVLDAPKAEPAAS